MFSFGDTVKHRHIPTLGIVKKQDGEFVELYVRSGDEVLEIKFHRDDLKLVTKSSIF